MGDTKLLNPFEWSKEFAPRPAVDFVAPFGRHRMLVKVEGEFLHHGQHPPERAAYLSGGTDLPVERLAADLHVEGSFVTTLGLGFFLVVVVAYGYGEGGLVEVYIRGWESELCCFMDELR
jgi:hypothetical protein